MWESRVLQRAFERLELHEGKLSRAVLRGGGGGDVTSLPDPGWATTQVYPARGDKLVAGPDVMRDRPAGDHHHGDDHLDVVRLAIAAVAVLGEAGRPGALEVGAGDVI